MSDLPLVSMLKTRLHWHQARQAVLAENVANASTPGFRPRDLQEPRGPRAAAFALPVDRTDALHLAAIGSVTTEVAERVAGFETRPSGNGVTLEDEMLKVASNQSDYQLAASLYQKSLAMLRTAVGARGPA